MRCEFCFAKYGNAKNVINRNDAMAIIQQIADAGFSKITFAGGEPLLYPNLSELIAHAKSFGLTTMLITNGFKLTPSFLNSVYDQLDWVGLSIDSLNPRTNLQIGRANANSIALRKSDYFKIATLIKEFGVGLKINTVVQRYNLLENFTDFINTVKPNRWKVMQVIFNKEVNFTAKDKYSISEEEFSEFILENRIYDPSIDVVAEPESLMRGSYLMIDPNGRLYDSSNGSHSYSPSIQSVGLQKAMKYIQFDPDIFIQRKGSYNWNLTKSNI